MKAYKNKILLKKIENEHSALIIPTSSKDKIDRGEVVSIGSLVTKKVDVGATVIFRKGGAQAIHFEGEDYLMVRDSDVYMQCEE